MSRGKGYSLKENLILCTNKIKPNTMKTHSQTLKLVQEINTVSMPDSNPRLLSDITNKFDIYSFPKKIVSSGGYHVITGDHSLVTGLPLESQSKMGGGGGGSFGFFPVFSRFLREKLQFLRNIAYVRVKKDAAAVAV